MESVRGPNVDLPDRLQVQEAPSAPALTGPLNPQQLIRCQGHKGDTFQPVGSSINTIGWLESDNPLGEV